MSKKVHRFTVLTASVACIALGVNLFLLSRLGSDPLTVLQQGLHMILGITVGQASLLYNGIVMLLAVLFARSRLGIGTVVYIVLVGILIDAFTLLFGGWILLNPAMRSVCLIAGQVAVTLGFALLIDIDLGTNGLDALLLAIEEKTNISYQMLKTAADILYTVSGLLMGGVAGFGTAVSVLSSGGLISFFRKLLKTNKGEPKCSNSPIQLKTI
jgi:hypothetical protein